MTPSGEHTDDHLAQAAPDAASDTSHLPSADLSPRLPSDREDLKWLRAVPPPFIMPTETDPWSETFVRDDIGETAGTILWFWFRSRNRRIKARES